MKQLFIDARLWGIKHTGIGRYTENLLRYLPKSNDIAVTLIVHPNDLYQSELQKYPRIIAKHHPYSILSQFEMFFLWLKYRPDLLHVTQSSIPVFWLGRIVVTFHDLIKHQSKGTSTTTQNKLFYWLKYVGLVCIDYLAANKAVAIIVPSRYWQDQLVAKYHLNSQKITVTYEGVDTQLITSTTDDSLLPSQPYVLYVGNLYPHKNLEVAYQSVKQLSGRIKLAIVCARSVFSSRAAVRIKELSLESDVVFLGQVTDAQLKSLYQHAIAFVFPSLIEGFGLPGLEAMSLGTPVLAAQASCLPEVYGSAAIYFAPHDSHTLTSLIINIQKNHILRKKMTNLGLERVKKYSWSKMSAQTWQVYQKVLL
jgi:glycosyltransferase involved in cell wall biosynthesis